MRGRVAEAAAVSALALIVTLAIAAPVLHAPNERVFGMEIVGRHHDPFTVMAQFARPITLGAYSQPVTDMTGAILARLSGPVAAYNWLVLLSFPLSAAAAYLLARHLALPPVPAAVAATAYAFSPFHVAHAAYHPHIAQTQWIPLYLLALWRCLDRPSPAAVGFLGAAALIVTLSNFYGGLIAAVITPVAVGAYWLSTFRAQPRPLRRLGITVGSLALIAMCGIAYASYVAGPVVVNRAAFGFPRADLFRYNAKWWSYLIPPVGHPVLGGFAQRVWTEAGVREGLLEHQVSLGWAIVALGVIANAGWLASSRPSARVAELRSPSSPKDSERGPALAYVPVVVIVALAALVCSLSPERTLGAFTFIRPSALLYDVLPMFRSYARFGVVVQLMAALLAGIGLDYLRRAGTRRAKIACVLLITAAAAEYAVAPAALWRDALPTQAHRWITRQPGRVRALDCIPATHETESIQWLTGHRVAVLGGSITDCAEPELSHKLAANGYTHLLVWRDTIDPLSFAGDTPPEGFRIAARFDDGKVFEVTRHAPAIYTAAMTRFYPRERDSEWTWRWMGADAAWTIVNTTAQPVVATLNVELSAFHGSRRLELLLDGRRVQTFAVEPPRRIYHTGPLTVTPGGHELVFHPVEAATVADDVIDNGDGRMLSFALGTWSWDVAGARR